MNKSLEEPSHESYPNQESDFENPEEVIREFKNNFEKYALEDPDTALRLKEDVLSMAGLKEHELIAEYMNFNFGIVKVPVDSLNFFGTACGDEGNKSFSGGAVDFLKSLGVEFIIGISSNDKFEFVSAAIPIDYEDGEKLQEMIYENGGSFRCDDSCVAGWTTYESE